MPPGRPEFILETAQEPFAFVIRKQVRTSANPMERPVVLAYYYIANNKIMQAPSAHQVTHARLQRCTFALQQGFSKLQGDLEPLTRQSKQLARQAARDEQQQQQQQRQQQAATQKRREELQEQRQQQQQQQQAQGQQEPAGLAGTEVAAPAGGLAGPAAAAAAPAASQPSALQKQPGAAAASTAHIVQPYAATVDLESPSLGTLRAPLAAPLPEVMAAAAATVSTSAPGGDAGGGGVPVRRHLTDADRARWNKLDRILSHQFNSLQRIKYTALPPEYLQRLHQQMYGPPPPAPPPATTAPAAADATAQ